MIETSHISKRVGHLFLVAAIMFLVALLTVAISIAHRSQRTNATLISALVRNSIILNDSRQSATLLQASLMDDLRKVGFHDSDGLERFEVSSSATLNSLLTSEISLQIFSSSEPNTESIGTLRFYFDQSFTYLLALSLWIVVIVMSYPVFLWYKKRLTERYNEQVRFQKSESIASLALQVAHDIRTPLTALKIVTSRAGNLPDKELKLLNQSVDRIDLIANELLRKNRGTRAGQQFDLTEAIAEAASEFATIISDSFTEFNYIGLPSKLVCAGSYKDDLQRVILNILTNSKEALEQNSPASPKISMTMSSRQNHVQIVIEDNGHGIPKELLKKLGSEKGTTTKEAGNGLGLYNAKETIVQNGGSIEISSELGCWTSITITLPLAPAIERAKNQS